MASIRVGLISDTHGLLRTEARESLQSCQQIIHAGDLDQPHLLGQLQQIAPTTAVRGNMDVGTWANKLKIVERIKIHKWSLAIVHNINDLDLAKEEGDIVIFGHSHRFHEENKDGKILINPGSAGPRRFTLPITMAILHLGEKLQLEKIILENKA